MKLSSKLKSNAKEFADFESSYEQNSAEIDIIILT
jgi:hypothetical protein